MFCFLEFLFGWFYNHWQFLLFIQKVIFKKAHRIGFSGLLRNLFLLTTKRWSIKKKLCSNACAVVRVLILVSSCKTKSVIFFAYLYYHVSKSLLCNLHNCYAYILGDGQWGVKKKTSRSNTCCCYIDNMACSIITIKLYIYHAHRLLSLFLGTWYHLQWYLKKLHALFRASL